MAEEEYSQYKNLPKPVRREKLFELFVQHGTMDYDSDRHLGTMFGVDHVTIANDKRSIANRFAHIPNKKLACEFNLYKLAGTKVLLEIIEKGEKDSDKVNAINALLNIAEKEISWRYKLGLVDIEPDKQQIEIRAITISRINHILEQTGNETGRILAFVNSAAEQEFA